MQPNRRNELFRGLEGKWVAIDQGKVIDAKNTPDELYAGLYSKQISGVTITRVPDVLEPEMVGMG